jgi:hypothetical protein
MPGWMQSLWNMVPASVRLALTNVFTGAALPALAALLVFVPPILSGVPAGMLYQRRERAKWIPAVPFLVLGIVAICTISM